MIIFVAKSQGPRLPNIEYHRSFELKCPILSFFFAFVLDIHIHIFLLLVFENPQFVTRNISSLPKYNST